MNPHNVSDELLNAFLDNELAASDKSRLFQLFEHDATLKAQACDMHNLKELMQHAYPIADHQPDTAAKHRYGRIPVYSYCLAASLAFLIFGGAVLWMLTTQATVQSYQKIISLVTTLQNTRMHDNPSKIILQIGNSSLVRQKMALDEAENLLQTYQTTGHPLELEIIANGGGLDLLRSRRSHYIDRLEAMQSKYSHLHFYACNLTLKSLQKAGVEVHLLPGTRIAASALSEISKRIREGWDYVRV